MKQIFVSSDRLASLVLGKNIDTGWRFQSDLTLVVDYEEWCKFMKEYNTSRVVLPITDKGFTKELFMLDIAWSLFNEVMLSINNNKDATLILPYFSDGKELTIVDAIREYVEIPEDVSRKLYLKLKLLNDDYYDLNSYGASINMSYRNSNISDWNSMLHNLAIYIAGQKDKIKFIWR